jgi:hypothetical protein
MRRFGNAKGGRYAQSGNVAKQALTSIVVARFPKNGEIVHGSSLEVHGVRPTRLSQLDKSQERSRGATTVKTVISVGGVATGLEMDHAPIRMKSYAGTFHRQNDADAAGNVGLF